MPLPYALDALEPVISRETLSFHHGKHHRAYVKKTNDAVAGTALDDASLEEIVMQARQSGNTAMFNQAAQVWNHGFYWHSLSPEPTDPSPELLGALCRQFGALADVEAALVKAGVGHFASGWVWLVRDGNDIKIIDTHDAETGVGQSWHPLLVIDVWEHAHYVDYRNDREAHLKALTSDRLNWQFASDNFARGSGWTYP